MSEISDEVTFAEAAVDLWGHPDREVHRIAGHAAIDPILADDAPARVHGPLTRWLDARRRAAWGPCWLGDARAL